MKKIISILALIVLISLISNLTFVFADESGSSSITDPTAIIKGMKNTSNMSNTNNRFGNILNVIIGLFQVVGTGIAVISVAILGIKYMLAAPAEKADTKKAIMPMVIGCVLLFGAVNLMAAVYDFASKVLSN